MEGSPATISERRCRIATCRQALNLRLRLKKASSRSCHPSNNLKTSSVIPMVFARPACRRDSEFVIIEGQLHACGVWRSHGSSTPENCRKVRRAGSAAPRLAAFRRRPSVRVPASRSVGIRNPSQISPWRRPLRDGEYVAETGRTFGLDGSAFANEPYRPGCCTCCVGAVGPLHLQFRTRSSRFTHLPPCANSGHCNSRHGAGVCGCKSLTALATCRSRGRHLA